MHLQRVERIPHCLAWPLKAVKWFAEEYHNSVEYQSLEIIVVIKDYGEGI